jgi:hypothetical protein|tara:strand:+ start:234 stop:665 length:432 start_codon:yes stop_codon:yes gene_type:complete
VYLLRLQTSLARALNRMKELFPDEYDFYPGTWTLPAQLDEFRKHCAAQAGKATALRPAEPATYIVKPSGGCQGAGIYLIRGVEGLLPHTASVSLMWSNPTPNNLHLRPSPFTLSPFTLHPSPSPFTLHPSPEPEPEPESWPQP